MSERSGKFEPQNVKMKEIIADWRMAGREITMVSTGGALTVIGGFLMVLSGFTPLGMFSGVIFALLGVMSIFLGVTQAKINFARRRYFEEPSIPVRTARVIQFVPRAAK